MPDTLTRPSGTALFVEQDRRTVLVRRLCVGTCTREEWADPVRRQAAITALYALTVATIRSEEQAVVGPSPVILYRDPFLGRVLYADIRTPGDPAPRWIDPLGRPLLVRPPWLGLLREVSSYAAWAEGPRAYVGDHEALPAPSPLEDRQLQEVRHRNRWLRELIDPAIAPSFDPIARDAGHEELVDFRIRVVCRQDDHRVLISKQTGDAAAVLVDGERIGLDEIDPAFTIQEA